MVKRRRESRLPNLPEMVKRCRESRLLVKPKRQRLSLFSNLPEDIILYNILTWLPSKTLMEWRRVCKSWYSVIKSPTFIGIHTSNQLSRPSHPHLLLHSENRECKFRYSFTMPKMIMRGRKLSSTWDDQEVEWSVLDPKYTNGPWRVLGSVPGGLVCLAIEDDLYMFNPCIRKLKKLPPLPPTTTPTPRGRRFSSDDPLTSIVGLGIVPSSGDYNVVEIDLDYNTHIYSSRTGSWKEVKVATKPLYVLWGKRRTSIYLKGVIYWMVEPLATRKTWASKPIILTFDIARESFRPIELPNGSSTDDVMIPGSIFVVEEKVSFVSFGFSEYRCDIWEMKRLQDPDNYSWTHSRHVVFAERVYPCRLSLTLRGEILVWDKGDNLVIYEPETRVYKRTGKEIYNQCRCYSVADGLLLLD